MLDGTSQCYSMQGTRGHASPKPQHQERYNSMSKFITTALSDKPFRASYAEVKNTLDSMSGGVGIKMQIASEKFDKKQGFVLVVDGVGIAVVFEDFPVPQERLAPLTRVEQEMRSDLVKHKAHALLWVVTEHAGHAGAVKAAMSILRVASALCKTTGAKSVLWDEAGTLWDASSFISLVNDMAKGVDHLPWQVLVRMIPYQTEAAGGEMLTGVVGIGLIPFTGRNLEIAARQLPAEAMLKRFMGYTRWFLMCGLVCHDGEIIGAINDGPNPGIMNEMARIRLLDKGQQLQTPVILIEIENADPAL